MGKQPIQTGIALGCAGLIALAILFSVVGALIASHTTGSGSAPFGGVCVSRPYQVAAGAAGSIYIEGSRGISHYSRKGKLLARFTVKSQTFATDREGNIYYASGATIVKYSGGGSRLGGFPAQGYQPVAVNPSGVILAVQGGLKSPFYGGTSVERFSAGGKLLTQWHSAYNQALAGGAGGRLYGIGGANDAGAMAQLDPKTGRVLRLLPHPLGFTYNAMTSDARGNIYIGATTSADAPFAVERMNPSGHSFKVLQNDQEQVVGLAVGSDGSIFVLRSSYDEPSPGDTGLFQLSPSGSSQNKFAFCKNR